MLAAAWQRQGVRHSNGGFFRFRGKWPVSERSPYARLSGAVREEKGQAKACPTKLVRAMGGACFSLPRPQGAACLPLLCRA
jgi:hypothetical protein